MFCLSVLCISGASDDIDRGERKQSQEFLTITQFIIGNQIEKLWFGLTKLIYSTRCRIKRVRCLEKVVKKFFAS